MSVTREQVRQVLAAVGEEFLVDVEATHDGKGGYFLEFSTVANALVNAPDEWLDRITGYVNVRDTDVIDGTATIKVPVYSNVPRRF